MQCTTASCARFATTDVSARAARSRAGSGASLSEGRKQRRRDVRVVPALDVAVSSNGHRETDDIRPLLAALPERQRAALFLRYYADLDYRGIAEALNVAPGTVAATLNAAHGALRRQLEEVER
jgi:RNA polymerase sigma factor (sigma-70 family)